MRVTEKDDQLILRTSWTSFLGSILFGLLFIGFAGYAFWAMARETVLTCTRLEANEMHCQITQMWLGQIVKQVTVSNPQQAIVQTQHSSKGGTTYRMALVTAQGKVPLTDFYSSDTAADRLADQFNQFQSDPAAKTVSIDQPSSGFVFIFLLIFFGLSMIMILTIHYDTFTFDRYRDALTFTRLGFRGVRTREESIADLKTEVRQFRGSKGRRYYCLYLRLASGDAIKVDWNASRQSAAQEVADRIQEFIRPGTHVKYANA